MAKKEKSKKTPKVEVKEGSIDKKEPLVPGTEVHEPYRWQRPQ